MKQLCTFLLILFACCTAAYAQSTTVMLINPQVSNNQLTFDVYAKNTGSTTIYMTDCTFYIKFNDSKFTSPSISFTASLPSTNYSTAINNYATTPKTFGIDILFNGTPSATNTVQMSSSGNGTLIGTVTLSGITTFTGTANLAWGTIPYDTYVSRWDPQLGGVTVPVTLGTPPVVYLGPVFDVTVQNQQLDGQDYLFDVYVKRTNGQNFYLGNSTFKLTFNSAKFSSPAATIVSRGTTKLTDYYSYGTGISGNTLTLTVGSPSTASQSEFDARVQTVSSIGNGLKIATVKLSPTTSPIAITDISPAWVTGANGTVVRTRRNATPWSAADDVTANATFDVLPPTVSLVLLTPNGGTTLCAGASLPITWTSENIQRVKLELVPQSGSAVTVAGNISATTGTYSWTVPALPGTWKMKITDLGNNEVNDQSDAFFDIQMTAQLTTQPVSKTACEGENVSFVSAGSGSPVIRWQVSTDGSTWQNVPNGTGATLTLPAVTMSLNGNRYRVIYTSSCSGDITSNTVTLTVNSAPTFMTSILPQTVCAGQSATFSFQMTGTPTPSIRWETSANNGTNWTTVPGATTTTLVLDNVQPSLNGVLVRAVLSNTCRQNVLSNNTLLTVNAGPTVQTQPQSMNACSGSTVVFQASASGIPVPVVQWQVNSGGIWQDVVGAITTTLTLQNVSPLQSGFQYRVVFVNPCGTTVSNAATLTVGSTIQITAQPQNTTVCEGQNAVITVVAAGIPTPTVVWRQSTDAVNWTVIPSQTNTTLTLPTVPASSNGLKLQAILSNLCTPGVTTNTITLTVQSAPAVTLQPQDVITCIGQTAVFRVQTSGSPAPSIQWQQNIGGTWENMPGKTSAELQLNDVRLEQGNTQYRVVLANPCSTGVASSSVRLYLLTSPTVALQPQDVAVCEGGSAIVQVGVSGVPTPSVQWQTSSNNGSTWDNVAQATSAVLTLGSIGRDRDNALFRAVLTNTCGTVTSTSARLTVNTAPEIAVPPQSTTACLNGTAVLTVSATGKPAPTLKWQSSFDGGGTWVDIAGATQSPLELTNIQMTQNQAMYRAVFSNICGDNVVSASAVLTVRTAPRITTQPVSRTVVVEQDVQFTVAATVAGTTQYRWYRDATPLVDNDRYSGTQTSQLLIRNVEPGDVSNAYYVVVTGDCGADTSDFAALNINVPGISIASQPQPVAVCEGGNVQFSITATTDVPGAVLSYRWRRGTVDLNNSGHYTGVNTPTLTITDATAAEAASNYNVRITVEPGGAMTYSHNVALRVDVLPAITDKPASISVCSGEPAAVEVVAAGSAPLAYKWLRDGEEVPGATSARYVIPAVTSQTEGRYTCVVSNPCGSATSQEAVVSMKTATSIVLQPEDVPGTLGREFTLRVSATGSGILTYQWYRNGTAVPGATSNEYTNVTLDSSSFGDYYCIVRGECGVDTSQVATVSIAVSVHESAGTAMTLGQNYPNPISGTTVIPVSLPSSMAVELVVRDAFGREVLVLYRGVLAAGSHTFRVETTGLSSGVYFYSLSGGGSMLTRSMIVAK